MKAILCIVFLGILILTVQCVTKHTYCSLTKEVLTICVCSAKNSGIPCFFDISIPVTMLTATERRCLANNNNLVGKSKTCMCLEECNGHTQGHLAMPTETCAIKAVKNITTILSHFSGFCCKVKRVLIESYLRLKKESFKGLLTSIKSVSRRTMPATLRIDWCRTLYLKIAKKLRILRQRNNTFTRQRERRNLNEKYIFKKTSKQTPSKITGSSMQPTPSERMHSHYKRATPIKGSFALSNTTSTVESTPSLVSFNTVIVSNNDHRPIPSQDLLLFDVKPTQKSSLQSTHSNLEATWTNSKNIKASPSVVTQPGKQRASMTFIIAKWLPLTTSYSKERHTTPLFTQRLKETSMFIKKTSIKITEYFSKGRILNTLHTVVEKPEATNSESTDGKYSSPESEGSLTMSADKVISPTSMSNTIGMLSSSVVLMTQLLPKTDAQPTRNGKASTSQAFRKASTSSFQTESNYSTPLLQTTDSQSTKAENITQPFRSIIDFLATSVQVSTSFETKHQSIIGKTKEQSLHSQAFASSSALSEDNTKYSQISSLAGGLTKTSSTSTSFDHTELPWISSLSYDASPMNTKSIYKFLSNGAVLPTAESNKHEQSLSHEISTSVAKPSLASPTVPLHPSISSPMKSKSPKQTQAKPLTLSSPIKFPSFKSYFYKVNYFSTIAAPIKSSLIWPSPSRPLPKQSKLPTQALSSEKLMTLSSPIEFLDYLSSYSKVNYLPLTTMVGPINNSLVGPSTRNRLKSTIPKYLYTTSILTAKSAPEFSKSLKHEALSSPTKYNIILSSSYNELPSTTPKSRIATTLLATKISLKTSSALLEITKYTNTLAKQMLVSKAQLDIMIQEKHGASVSMAPTLDSQLEQTKYFTELALTVVTPTSARDVMIKPTEALRQKNHKEIFQIKFKGNCPAKLQAFKIPFLKTLQRLIAIKLSLVEIKKIKCGSIMIVFSIECEKLSKIPEILNDLVQNGHFRVKMNGIIYYAINIKKWKEPISKPTTATIPTTSGTTLIEYSTIDITKLNERRAIMITFILFASIFVSLVLFGVVVCIARACGRKPYGKLKVHSSTLSTRGTNQLYKNELELIRLSPLHHGADYYGGRVVERREDCNENDEKVDNRTALLNRLRNDEIASRRGKIIVKEEDSYSSIAFY